MAASLAAVVLCRVLQGWPAADSSLPARECCSTLSPEKQGAAMTMFGMAALLAPMVGPTLGGWLVDNYGWRWIFYINSLWVFSPFSPATPCSRPRLPQQQRAELQRKPLNFDGIGLGLLALTMVSWEVMLSKGQEWDWLGDPFWRVQTLRSCSCWRPAA